jgi:hypothetical protein
LDFTQNLGYIPAQEKISPGAFAAGASVNVRILVERGLQWPEIVSLSGMIKQNYNVSKHLDRSIIVKGSCEVHRAVLLNCYGS